MVRGTFLKFHRQAWLWIDEWIDLSTEQVKLYDEDVTAHLKQIEVRSGI
jgi:hypothetical protein